MGRFQWEARARPSAGCGSEANTAGIGVGRRTLIPTAHLNFRPLRKMAPRFYKRVIGNFLVSELLLRYMRSLQAQNQAQIGLFCGYEHCGPKLQQFTHLKNLFTYGCQSCCHHNVPGALLLYALVKKSHYKLLLLYVHHTLYMAKVSG